MAISTNKRTGIMATLHHSNVSSRDGHKRSPNENSKKRRQRGSGREEDGSISSLPPTKKTKTGDNFHQDETIERSYPMLDHHNITPSSSNDHADIECHIGTSLMKGLVASYQLSDMNIISSSKIQSKVTIIVEKLGSFSFVTATKPNIVLLRAKSPVASKLITIVEIVKREIAMAGGKWYQYNVLGQLTAPQTRTSRSVNGITLGQGPKSNLAVDEMELDDKGDSKIFNDEGIVFETMKTPLERATEGKPKIRDVPMILIFLTRVRCDTLKRAYGEQTNALT